MAGPEKTKPDALGKASGRIEDREEPSTESVYTDAVSDRDWESAVAAVLKIAGGDSPRGERGRRAIHALADQPYVSRPVWAAADAVAWIFVAAIVSADDDLRARANAQVKQVLALASQARESLGRAA